jgi:hypothetical protein
MRIEDGMLRRSLITAGAIMAVSACLAAGASAQVRAVPSAVPTDASTLPFNTQAQIVAGNIVDADESASAKADGLAVRATAYKPPAKNYDASIVGMSIIAPGLQITVAHHASAALTQAIKDQADGMPVSIRIVDHSPAQLAAVQAKIGAHLKFWAARGIKLTAWGPDLSSDKVSVTRTDDAPPWYGGDEIIHRYSSTAVEECTSGFGLSILGAKYVPTAAHCLESNYSNDFYNPDGNEVGTIWGCDDVEDTVIITAASVLGDIWSDPTSTSRSVVKVAPSDPLNGVETTLGSTQATARDEILARNTDASNNSCGWYLPERTIESDWDASTVLG